MQTGEKKEGELAHGKWPLPPFNQGQPEIQVKGGKNEFIPNPELLPLGLPDPLSFIHLFMHLNLRRTVTACLLCSEQTQTQPCLGGYISGVLAPWTPKRPSPPGHLRLSMYRLQLGPLVSWALASFTAIR